MTTRLRIAIEDGSNEEFRVKYGADAENSEISPHVQVPGWKLTDAHSEVVQQRYGTNYGDTSLPTHNESVYSRYMFSIGLARPNYGYFIKLLFGLFVATAIAFLAFCMKPSEPRFGLGAGAIFAAVASEYICAANLPVTNVLTMADVLHILAFVFIFLSIAESTAAWHLFQSGIDSRIRLSRRLDLWSLLVLGGSYVGLSMWTVLRY